MNKCSSEVISLRHLAPEHSSLWRQAIELDLNEFSHPWTEEQWHQTFEVYTPYFFLNYHADSYELLSSALLLMTPGDDLAHLVKIQTRRSAQGKGHAKELFMEIIRTLASDGLKTIYLEVEESNHPAVQFYHHHQFLVLRRLKDFYGQSRHALAMAKSLTATAPHL